MIYQLEQKQLIPANVEEVWEFISNPNNLKEITPDYLGFKVTSKMSQNTMYAGMIITYIVKPILGIPITWMTEITHVVDKQYFVDEQRIGPYKMWHHQHKIETTDKGVLMTDIVTYVPPLGVLGRIAHFLFIKKQLMGIFEYRTKAVENRFGKV